ncbi:MAG: HEAT repeat domain-containing protein [Candidatus Bipolaricaulia bacterium]
MELLIGILIGFVWLFVRKRRGKSKLAVRKLVKIGPAAVPTLIKVLQDKDVDVRQEAAEALGKIGPDARDAVPALVEALRDEDWSVRQFSAWALRKIGPDAVPALIEALEDEDERVRDNATRVLQVLKKEKNRVGVK